MKTISTFTLAAAAVAFAASTALGDDQQLQHRLAIQREQNAKMAQKEPTVAVYAQRHGVGGTTSRDQRYDQRTETGPDVHSRQFSVFIPGK